MLPGGGSVNISHDLALVKKSFSLYEKLIDISQDIPYKDIGVLLIKNASLRKILDYLAA